MINILDYGAISGDNKVNVIANTKAIQEAVDVANSAGGGTVFVPEGVFVTDTIIMYSNVTIQGENKYTSILKLKSNPSGALLECSGTENCIKENMAIRNLTLKHNKTFDKKDEIKGVLVRGYSTMYCEITDCIFKEYSVYGILLSYIDNNNTYAKSWVINNCIFTDSRLDSSKAIFLYDQAEYVRISNCTFNTICIAIESMDSANISIINNSFIKCGNLSKQCPTISILSKTGCNGGKVLIEGNAINHNNYSAIIMQHFNGTTVQYGCRISNNDILVNEGHTFIPLRLIGSQGTTIIGNRICGIPGGNVNGISFYDNDASICDYNIVTNNIIMNGTTVNNSTGTHNVITGNIVNTPQ